MNWNGTLKNVRTFVCIIVTALSSLRGYSQPEYTFKNPVLVSGTDLQVGAVYRYSNVRPGTDAIVTITDLNKISLTQFDGASGFDEAFQPYIWCPGKTKGYAEFRFDFVTAGTSTAKTMTEVPVTAIDIDGFEFPDAKIYEFDEFKTTPSYYVDYDLLGSSLTISNTAGWQSALNKTGVVYPGIDTIQQDVMFSMIYGNVSSITLRVGADNKSATAMERLRSDYFQKFRFPSSILPVSPLLNFSSVAKTSAVELQWTIAASSNFASVVLERAYSPNQFQAISNQPVTEKQASYQYTDAAQSGTVYYRLKMIGFTGAISYSNVIVCKAAATTTSLSVYPTVVTGNATVNINSGVTEQTNLQVVDLSGRLVYRQVITLQKGSNTFSVSGLAKLLPGTYVAMVNNGGNLYSQKIMVN
ncbi:MAG: T9SS type A sorting domain-containing protein [Bacteroidota bacterium]|nr:T9SS type A sorting domain-containing protein [Bacteroidota bacterium]